MRYFFILGGGIGFSLAALSGWFADHAPDRILRDASVGALVGGVLFRWWWSGLMRGFHEAVEARSKAKPPASTPTPVTKVKTP